jgi:hypothetical protein
MKLPQYAAYKMKPLEYTALELIERIQEEHAKLGNHPSVGVKFSTSADEVKAHIPATSPPFIVIPLSHE